MEKIRQLVAGVIKKLYGLDGEINVVVAPKETGADFASNVAMSLAKTLKKNPFEIAEEIGVELKQSENLDRVEVARPGFINMKLGEKFYKSELEKYQKDFLKNISQDEYLNKKVIWRANRKSSSGPRETDPSPPLREAADGSPQTPCSRSF